MKYKASLKDAKDDKDSQIVKRGKRLVVINKKKPRKKRTQGKK